MDLNKFVENVKYYSSLKGKSGTAACIEAGLSRTFLTDVVHKKTQPRIGSVFALSKYLGVTVSDLLGESSQSNCDYVLLAGDAELLTAYHQATPEEQQAISLILRKYMKKENASLG